MAEWKAGSARKINRDAMTDHLTGHAKSSESIAQTYAKGVGVSMSAAALGCLGVMGLALAGATGGLAIPAVMLGMNAMMGASMSFATGAGLLKMLKKTEDKRANALGLAADRLRNGAMMDSVLQGLERGDGSLPALGKGFVERLGFRRAAKLEREQLKAAPRRLNAPMAKSG